MTIDRTELDRLIAARPPGPRTAMQGVRDNYADIERMRERGCSWAEVSEILARLGVVSRDGSPIFVVTLRSAFFLVGIELRNGGPKGGAVTCLESRDDDDWSQEAKSTVAPPILADSASAARLGGGEPGGEPAPAGEVTTPAERVVGVTLAAAVVGSADAASAAGDNGMPETPQRVTADVALSWDWTSRRGDGV